MFFPSTEEFLCLGLASDLSITGCCCCCRDVGFGDLFTFDTDVATPCCCDLLTGVVLTNKLDRLLDPAVDEKKQNIVFKIGEHHKHNCFISSPKYLNNATVYTQNLPVLVDEIELLSLVVSIGEAGGLSYKFVSIEEVTPPMAGGETIPNIAVLEF